MATRVPPSCDKCDCHVTEEHYGHVFYTCRHLDAEGMHWGKYTDYVPCDCPKYQQEVHNA